MKIEIITCVPNLLESPLNHSIVQRAKDKGLVDIRIHNLHTYGKGTYKQIDDKPYGGGAGMVLMIEPIVKCLENLQKAHAYDEIVYMAPEGKLWNQQTANSFALKKSLIILCGHYKGIDERIRQYFVTQEISIGNYVLSGGELPAAILVDSIIRLLPGVLSDETSALTDSFQDGRIAPPVYTRPALFKGLEVPKILRSGNAAAIEEWQIQEAYQRTKKYEKTNKQR